MFHQLIKVNIIVIAAKLLDQLKSRLADNKIDATFSDEAVEKIADEGFDPVYGARPLRRAIQSKIEDRTAQDMLEGKVKAEDHIEVTVEDGKFTCVPKTE